MASLVQLGAVERSGDRAKDLEAVRAIFQTWSTVHFASSISEASQLYAFLCSKIPEDASVVEIALEVVNTPLPLVFFASVQFLLSKHTEHPLRNYFASYRDPPLSIDADTYRHFHEFVLSHKAELLPLLHTRLVQTNEVRRCALLLPALHAAVQHLPPPYAFIEFGSSAGLNLLPDHYAYRYTFPDGRTATVGDASAALQLQCEVRSPVLPLPSAVPSATHRIGIDLMPLDVASDDDVHWLKSLIWPEHRERRERLSAAVEVARRHPVRHIAGDVVVRLREVFALVPPGESIVVLHSFVVNQLPTAVRDALLATMRELSTARPFVEIAAEFVAINSPPIVSVTRWRSGEKDTTQLAECSAHGLWIKWLDSDKK